ncbi:cytochrome P450 [Annulohypoxylon maeteangense]|uniref:cytochrome P450 n=1 Tax=Annulohypoxylon maeteangense TaxID=1927788 RepID=UPI0020089DAB|nr:cytochrome P450 [Annulohypoxylon maeteangense]KAI0881626.1 cytochrome P450 [Annulohypoxylon maeteangense]
MLGLWVQPISSIPQACTAVSLLVSSFIIIKVFYRLFLSPLSKFPGPKLAAATKLYEAYHVLIKNDWLENLKNLHEIYGPVVRLGPNELHFVDHEACLKHHNRADLRKCDNYYGILNTLLGGLALPQAHGERKSMIQPLFTGSNLSSYSGTEMNTQLQTLHEMLTSSSETKATPTNLTHVLWAYTNDIMTSYLLGEDLGFMKSPDLIAMHDSTRAFSAIDLATVLRSMPPLKKLLDIFPSLRKISPLSWLDALAGSHLERITKGDALGPPEKGHKNVLSQIWRQIGNEQIVIQEAAQAIFIGNESLMSNLTFLLHNMIQNPDCVTKLRAEIDRSLDVGTYGHQVWRDPKVLQLPYLDALCRESTRLSSPSWHRQPRQTSEPVTYNETVIPPMTSLSFTLHLLERDPILYPDPETFKPDRWLGFGPNARKLRNNSVTFGTGTRTCLGQFIARHVLRKTLVAILYNFNISLWDETRDKAEGYRYLDTYPKKGHEGYLRVKLTPRFGEI